MGGCMSWHSGAKSSIQVSPCPPCVQASPEDGPPCKVRRTLPPTPAPDATLVTPGHEAKLPPSLLLTCSPPRHAEGLPKCTCSLSADIPNASSPTSPGGSPCRPCRPCHPCPSCFPPRPAQPDLCQLTLGLLGPSPAPEDGDFPLSANPGVVLRILSECRMSPLDLARLEATCQFFRSPAGFPPDSSLGLAEVAALDCCMRRTAVKAMGTDRCLALRAACGGSWKLLLRFLLAREACTRSGKAQVAAGGAHSIVVGSQGEVFSFGHASVGQLGHGPQTENSWRPKQIKGVTGLRVVQAAAGRSRTMLVTECGRVYHFGRDCFGDQEYSLASPRPIHDPLPVQALQNIHVVQVAMGSFFTAVLSAEGKVYTFSWGESERLGHATDLTDTEARLLEGGGIEKLPVVQIAGGHCYLLMLAMSKDHGRSLWSVGCGLGGKLGHGTRSDERVPKEITHFKTIGFEPVAVAAGAWHAVALSSDGRVATWGWGRHGCLGHGTDQCETVPRVIDSLAGSVACHVAAGDYTTFVVGSRGEVWSFGSTESSCLGHGPDAAAAAGGQGETESEDNEQLQEAPMQRPRDVFLPRRVAALEGCVGAGDRVVQISTSNAGHWDAHMLAMTEHGTVLACGAGSKGQLGCLLPEGGFERSLPRVVEGLPL